MFPSSLISTFTTSLNYSHQILRDVNLQDESCKNIHSHKSSLKFSFDVGEEFIDFKTLKESVRYVLDDLEGKNITAYVDIHTTEEFLGYLYEEIKPRAKWLKAIEIQETPKYGMIYAPNQ